MRLYFNFIATLFVTLVSLQIHAYPEFSRYGYFSCTSCHVSSGGGGLLTPYGRGFAAEKLATWAKPNEGQILHGLLKDPPEHWLIGANFRMIQTYEKSATRKRGRWFPMQRQWQLGAVFEKFGVVADINVEDKEVNPSREKGIFASYEHYALVSPTEYLQIRAGRFYPRFGLMIVQHPSFIRDGLGFSPAQESYNAEVGYFSEFHEVIVSYLAGKGGGPLHGGKKEEKKVRRINGFAANYAYFLRSAHRLGVSLMQERDEARDRTLMGANASVAVTDKIGFLAELDQETERSADTVTRKTVTYGKLYAELVRGLFPGVVHEYSLTKGESSELDQARYGAVMQWHPRPHFEFEIFGGALQSQKPRSFAQTAYFLVHYYL